MKLQGFFQEINKVGNANSQNLGSIRMVTYSNTSAIRLRKMCIKCALILLTYHLLFLSIIIPVPFIKIQAIFMQLAIRNMGRTFVLFTAICIKIQLKPKELFLLLSKTIMILNQHHI